VQERLAQAERGRAAARVMAVEERKRRRLAVGLAASVLAVVVLLAGGAMWQQRQRAQSRRAAEEALDRAGRLMARARWDEARAVLEQAAPAAPADLAGRLGQARQDLDLAAQLDAIRLRKMALAGYRARRESADREYTGAFARAGLARPGDDPAEVAQRLRDSSLHPALVAALDDWAVSTPDPARRTWVLAVARSADPDPWRDRFRDPSVWEQREALERLAKEAPVGELSPALVTALAQRLLSAGGDAVGLLRRAHALHPGDFWLNFELGNALAHAGRPAESVGYYQAALALRPDTAAVYNNLGLALGYAGRPDEAVASLRKAAELAPRDPATLDNLGLAWKQAGRLDEAVASHSRALTLGPNDFVAHNNLGVALARQGHQDQAEAEYRRALKLNPRFAPALANLGGELLRRGKTAEALPLLERAVASDPRLAEARYYLGTALAKRGRSAEAVPHLREAVRLAPANGVFRYNLGLALHAAGKQAEARSAFEKAVERSPRDTRPLLALADTLVEEGRREEAVAAYRKAETLGVRSAALYLALGVNLEVLGRLPEATEAYRRAVKADAKRAAAHYHLGRALARARALDEAIPPLRQAVKLDPRHADAWYNLGNSLRDRGRPDEAAEAFARAVKVDPDFAEAHCNLGLVLRDRGRFRAALGPLRKGHELGSKRSDWRYPSGEWLRQAERLAELDDRLAAVRAGKPEPEGAGELVELAEFSAGRKRCYRTAARLFASAFAQEPGLARDPRGLRRYNAACAAAKAAAGKGDDAGKPDEKEKARLRGLALDWLKAELAVWATEAEVTSPETRRLVAGHMRHWQSDTDLAGVRDESALAKLPGAERADWRKLWAQVSALARKAGAGPKP
jgi:tetratricopeptide (TPR) repeat protein